MLTFCESAVWVEYCLLMNGPGVGDPARRTPKIGHMVYLGTLMDTGKIIQSVIIPATVVQLVRTSSIMRLVMSSSPD